jgi:hypothetical protein
LVEGAEPKSAPFSIGEEKAKINIYVRAFIEKE